MYCPSCGSQNIEAARFCRKCGSAIAFASQPLAVDGFQDRGELIRLTASTTQRAIKKLSSGILLLCMAIFFIVAHKGWAFWLLFPAFVMLGKGISILVANRIAGMPSPRKIMSQGQDYPVTNQRSAPRTGEISKDDSMPLPPPSVTEGTTRIITPASEQYGERP